LNSNVSDIKITSEKSIAVTLIYAFTICVAVFFTIVFIVLYLNFEEANFSNTFILPIGFLSMLLVLFLMRKKKYKVAKYLISTIPPFIIVTLSVMTKSHGVGDTIYLYLAPRMFTMVFLTVPIIFFGLNNRRELIISCAILLIPAIFFDAIHNAAGIYIGDLSYNSNTYIFLVLIISMMYLFIFASILFFQKMGLKFRTRMKKSHAALIQEKTEIIALNKRLEHQAYLYKVLNITSENKPINIILQEVLDVIVNSDALTSKKKGVIFLTNDQDELEIVALHGAPELIKSCSTVQSGECLCGQVLLNKKMTFCNSVGHDHTIKPEGISPHGHYVVPIEQNEIVLGVINIYIDAGAVKSDSMIEYLEAIANILAKKITDVHNTALILDSKNKLDTTLIELNHGIRYASYLQKSLLPDQSTLNSYFKDCSVLYLPRDEVSGDFYFANGNDNMLYFGVGDCTGHGVPGSLLASMSIEAVKHVIESNWGESPAQLLTKLRSIAMGRFTTNEEHNYSDSMDAALCLYNRENATLQFSGGYVNLYVINANSEITSYVATKCPVGSYAIEQEFELHEIQLNEGDTLYISSDGYFDQFGMNPESKKNRPQKYKRKRFLDFIKGIHQFDSQKQVDILFEELELWKQDLDQIDDVTVMVLKH
jgi:serine phosphatase RsbU (regulator of sigma subunit)/putative methionine-R-sulfoxide reductase with GAF domain